MSLVSKLAPVKARYEELSSLMSAGDLGGDKFVKLSREYAEIEPMVELLNNYEKALKEFEDLKILMDDPEMRDMAEAEYYALKERIPELEHYIQVALLPKDEADAKDAVLEIRAGTGGQEAALFAADLFAMYRGYAARQGWTLEVVEMSESDLGGYKEIIAEVRGRNVFEKLKYESGVHRVQRVPETEAQGRVHTSAATAYHITGGILAA
jgi:peptide chain release factor 1